MTFFHLSIFGLFAQGDNSKVNRKIARRLEPIGNEAFRIGEYSTALEIYQELTALYPDNPGYNYKLGVSYLNSSYKKSAVEALLKAEKGSKETDLNYYLGRAFHIRNEFDRAIDYYNKFLEEASNRKNIAPKIEEAQRAIAMCNTGKKLIAKPIDIKLTNLGPRVNSAYADFSPLASADGQTLIFTSRRSETPYDIPDPLTGQYYEDIYVAKKVDGVWTDAENIGQPVNSDTHDAAVCISGDGQKIVFYRASQGFFRNQVSGDLYETSLAGARWSIPEKLRGKVNSRGWEPSACIVEDQNEIYFSSNREGGFGGRDIYKAKRQEDGSWSTPINLGPEVNTPYDEDAPFIHEDGKLYFASNGHDTMGGFDIFYTSSKGENIWSTPENLGYPLNTSEDDIYFFLNPDGKTGFLSTIRNDTFGGVDIYEFVWVR